jgi:hypothetical protein
VRVVAAIALAIGAAGPGEALAGGGPTEVLAIHPLSATLVVGETVRLRAFFCLLPSQGSFFGDDGDPQTADDQCQPTRATWSVDGRGGKVAPKRGRATTFTATRAENVRVLAETQRSRNLRFSSSIRITILAEAPPSQQPPVLPTEALVVYPFGAEIEAGGSVVFTAWVCPTDATGRTDLGSDGWPGNAGDGGDVVDDGCVLVDADWEPEGGAAAIASVGQQTGFAGGPLWLREPSRGPGVSVIGFQRGTGGLSAHYGNLSGGTTFMIGDGPAPTTFPCTFPSRSRLPVGGRVLLTAGHCGFQGDVLADPGPDGVLFTPDDPGNKPVTTGFRRLGLAASVDPTGQVTAAAAGYSTIVTTDPQGRQGLANVRVFEVGQDLPIDAFFADTGIPPSVEPREWIEAIRRLDEPPDQRDAMVFSQGSDAAGDRVDCATGMSTQDGPGAEILGAVDQWQGGTFTSWVLMQRDPMVSSSDDWSWAVLRTLFFPTTPQRTFLNQIHDDVVTMGEVDSAGRIIPGTEQTTSVADGFVRFDHPIGTEFPTAVRYDAFNMTGPDQPRVCDTLITVPAPARFPPANGDGLCKVGTGTLCLDNDRFQVQATSVDSTGTSTEGTAKPLGDPTSGLFFFSQSNTDILLKVLNACSLNDRYWVFSAATTSVEFTLTVTDTQRNAVKTYSNPQGKPFAPIQDTQAFATCP